MLPLSLAHLTIADASPEELARAAAEAGFGAVGMRITGFTPQGAGPQLVGNPRALGNLRQSLNDGGLAVTSVCTYRLTADVQTADFAPVFDACREISADTVLITSFIEDPSLAADRFACLVQMADEVGLRIGVEFLRTSALRSLDAAETLCRKARASNVGHIIDALHLCRCGHSPADLRRIPTHAIFGVQICDAALAEPLAEVAAAEVRSRLYPGEGELPLFDLLDYAGPEAWIEIEAPKASHAGLSISERAVLAFASGHALLDAHCARA